MSCGDELDRLRAHVAQVTTIDELTGCYNRRHLLEVLHQHRGMAERGSYQFTLAVARVDQFSELVDREELERGNEVLQLFSRIVRAALREVDVIARLEADRFGLILSGCTEDDALDIINRISQLISQIQITDEDDVKITASGGLTSYHGTESPEELIEHAEQALQFAMEQGDDHVAGYLYTSVDTSEAETMDETSSH
ncbi:MAG: GGDEF domain-containing protein [Gammaproteobacteria bacterium]|nr:GGDEF domain-containing protein [Gammaproteobacteria bacterium]